MFCSESGGLRVGSAAWDLLAPPAVRSRPRGAECRDPFSRRERRTFGELFDPFSRREPESSGKPFHPFSLGAECAPVEKAFRTKRSKSLFAKRFLIPFSSRNHTGNRGQKGSERGPFRGLSATLSGGFSWLPSRNGRKRVQKVSETFRAPRREEGSKKGGAGPIDRPRSRTQLLTPSRREDCPRSAEARGSRSSPFARSRARGPARVRLHKRTAFASFLYRR
jgi:hypothetical protein